MFFDKKSIRFFLILLEGDLDFSFSLNETPIALKCLGDHLITFNNLSGLNVGLAEIFSFFFQVRKLGLNHRIFFFIDLILGDFVLLIVFFQSIWNLWTLLKVFIGFFFNFLEFLTEDILPVLWGEYSLILRFFSGVWAGGVSLTGNTMSSFRILSSWGVLSIEEIISSSSASSSAKVLL